MKKGVWEHLLATTPVWSFKSAGQLKWVGLNQVRALLVWCVDSFLEADGGKRY